MSLDEPNIDDGAERRAAVRKKAQQVTTRQRRSRWAILTVLVVGGLAVIAAAVVAVVSVVMPQVTKPDAVPMNMDGGAIPVSLDDDLSRLTESSGASEPEAATDDAAVAIDIYVDYQSPASSQFDAANAAQLVDWVKQGAATVTYHPVALQTAQSNGTKYSARAAGAVACVRSLSPATAVAFSHELLLSSPEPDTSGFTNDQLAEIAVAVGVDDADAVRSCIDDETYVGWANDVTQQLVAAPLPDTDGVMLSAAPTVLVDGRVFVGSPEDPAEFAQFALTVASEKYYETDTPSPEPTP